LLSLTPINTQAKNLTPADVMVDIQATRLRVVVRYIDTLSGKEVVKEEIVIDKELFGIVDVDKSSFSILKPKVEVVLSKVMT
jgi:hypothetical protein